VLLEKLLLADQLKKFPQFYVSGRCITVRATAPCPEPDESSLHPLILFLESSFHGRDIAQAVSRRLPTAAARVRAQFRSCGICSGQSGTGAGFLRVFLFPLPILILPTAPHSSSIRGWYNRPISGLGTKWIQSHPTPRN
jgi:hypothetical protein